jgi:hypothetical protein
VKTIIGNWVAMCPKKPSRVPGRRHTATSWPSTSRTDTGRLPAGPAGVSRTTAGTSTATSSPAPAAAPKATGHPAACSSPANGTAETTCPSWQRIVVSWVISGTRRAGNQRGTSASAAVNTTASPAPTSTLASTASGSAPASASSSWPAAITSALAVSMTRDPYRSTSAPAGSWAAT